MTVVIRASVKLQPGCKLYYDCPLRGESFEANRFFEKRHGQYATFVGYSEQFIGVLDHKGLLPGRYINPEGIRVQFDGEEVQGLNIRHFVVLDPTKATLEVSAGQRLGDLPHPILFYPDDLVRFKEKPEANLSNDPRKVSSLSIESTVEEMHPHRYEILETPAEFAERRQRRAELNEQEGTGFPLLFRNEPRRWFATGDNLTLVSRGNVWALYNDPTQLSFESDDTESAFWGRDGISKRVSGSEAKKRGHDVSVITTVHGHTLEKAYEIFRAEEADIINLATLKPRHTDPDRFVTRQLHECFADQRTRVRKLTERLWHPRLTDSAA